MSKFEDDIYEALGIGNPYQASRRYECPVIYYYTRHPHAIGTSDYRAEVNFPRDGKWWTSKPLHASRGGTAKERREAHLEAATEWAAERLGVTEWVPTGWSNTWMPKDVHARMRAELAEWRKAQKAVKAKEETKGEQ